MKILVYAHRIGSKTITFIHNEINQLAKDHEVMVLYHYDEKVLALENCSLQKIRHYHSRPVSKVLSVADKILSPLGIKLPSFANEMQKHIKHFNPDVVHIHFGTIAERVLWCNEITDRPVFISFHGYDASRALKQASYLNRLKYLFDQARIHPIFVSHFMYKNVCQALGVSSISNHHILYYGTDLSFFQRQSYPNNNPKVFLQVSSFVEKKGHIYTVDAFKQYIEEYGTEQPVQLILAGGGQLLEEIQDYVEEKNLSEHIRFTGWIDKAQARDLMEQADYFVHHSIVDSNGDMEGIPNAIMEAMAMELPVLSTVHSGIPELVEDGVNGYLVEEKSISQYAESIKKILALSHSKKNRDKVMSGFELIKHKEFLTHYYTKSLKS